MNEVSAACIAAVQRELAQLAAYDEAIRLAPRSVRRKPGASIVYSIRLLEAAVGELRATVI